MEDIDEYFIVNDIEYVVSIRECLRYDKCIKFFGINIGYGKKYHVKAIDFNLKSNENDLYIKDINYKNSYTHVKTVLSMIEHIVSSNIEINDIIWFTGISDSRDVIFNRLLNNNEWKEYSNSHYFCQHKPLHLYKKFVIDLPGLYIG